MTHGTFLNRGGHQENIDEKPIGEHSNGNRARMSEHRQTSVTEGVELPMKGGVVLWGIVQTLIDSPPSSAQGFRSFTSEDLYMRHISWEL